MRYRCTEIHREWPDTQTLILDEAVAEYSLAFAIQALPVSQGQVATGKDGEGANHPRAGSSWENLIRHMQGTEYADEIKSLREGMKGIKKGSKIYQLDTALTATGVSACGARNLKAQPPDDSTHPVILPRDHWLLTLVLKFYHEQSGHSGREYTVAEVQQRYWIPGFAPLLDVS